MTDGDSNSLANNAPVAVKKTPRERGFSPIWIIPIVDTIPAWIDHRVMVTPFTAERTLTKDTVPVDIDAICFWMVWDAKKAILEVEDF